MKNIEFVDWVDYDDYEKPDYLKDDDLTKKDRQKLAQLVVEQIKKDLKRCTGEDHQTKPNCAPMFSIDGKNYVFTASMRYWGSLMAYAWNEIENTHAYSYISFYI